MFFQQTEAVDEVATKAHVCFKFIEEPPNTILISSLRNFPEGASDSPLLNNVLTIKVKNIVAIAKHSKKTKMTDGSLYWMIGTGFI